MLNALNDCLRTMLMLPTEQKSMKCVTGLVFWFCKVGDLVQNICSGILDIAMSPLLQAELRRLVDSEKGLECL